MGHGEVGCVDRWSSLCSVISVVLPTASAGRSISPRLTAAHPVASLPPGPWGAQAEDGKSVGGKDNERVAGDGENCGDRIDGKNEIGGAKGDEDEEEGSAGPAALFTEKKAVPMKIGCDGDEFPSQTNQGVVVGFDFRFATFEEFDSGVNEKSTKEVDQPMKAID